MYSQTRQHMKVILQLQELTRLLVTKCQPIPIKLKAGWARKQFCRSENEINPLPIQDRFLGCAVRSAVNTPSEL
jgi:hypothetical protein